jgi:hypothetical protein
VTGNKCIAHAKIRDIHKLQQAGVKELLYNLCEHVTSVDIIRDGTASNLHTGKYQNVADKDGCEEEEVGLNWIIGCFVSNDVKNFGVF